MTAISDALTRELSERDKIKSRCKHPSKSLQTQYDAKRAWDHYKEYKRKADFAYTKYMQAGIGTATQRRYCTRWEAFSDVADEWEYSLDKWFAQ